MPFANAARIAATMLLFAVRIAIAQVTSGGNPATTPRPRAEAWWVARHQQKVLEAQRGGVDLLFLGDSITQNYEKPGPAPNEIFLPTWNEFFAPHHAANLGFSGDETAHLLWRLQNGEVEGLNPKDVVLLIGTNNTAHGQTAHEVTAGILAVTEETHRLLPHARILIVAILPSAVSPQKSAADDAVNEAVKQHYASSPYARTLDLGYLFAQNGTVDGTLFYDPNLNPPRAPLHPNTEGQRRMAQAVSAALFPR